MRIVRLDTTDSTMLEARRRLVAGEEPPFTVIAQRQTGGIGRLGRPWSSPPGGWWFTVAAPLAAGQRTVEGSCSLQIAHAVHTHCDAILTALGGPHVRRPLIKWPNDIMVGDLKLAGILIEVVQPAGQTNEHRPAEPAVMVGIGINANVDIPDFDAELKDRVTSLRAQLLKSVDPAIESHTLAKLPERIANEIQWPLRSAGTLVRQHLWGVGRTVPITLADGSRVSGRIDGVTDEGDLVATIDGVQRKLRSVDQIG